MKFAEPRPIKDYCLGIYDGPHATPKEAGDGPVFLGIKNITDDGALDLSEIRHVSEEEYPRWTRRVTPQAGDVVFTYEATLHRYAVVPDGFRGCLGRRVALVRPDPDQVDSRYLLYFFLSRGWRQVIESNVITGATVDRVPLERFPSFPAALPQLRIQQQIAEILSAYDDLIENNQRRMALLEEAARQLYREWFVRLHFPGHEHTRITNGVPEEWCQSRFEQVLAALESGGRPRGGAKTDHGIPSIGAENVLGIGRYDYSKEKFVPEEYYEKMTCGVIRNRDLVLYKDGANIGRTSYFGDGFPHLKCAVNEHVFILRAHPSVGQSFLYFWLTRDENRQAIENLNANTAQPGISQGKLKGLKVLLPPEWLTRAFNEAVEALVKQIFTLAVMSRKLSATRNLLLPRLMSGEIAV